MAETPAVRPSTHSDERDIRHIGGTYFFYAPPNRVFTTSHSYWVDTFRLFETNLFNPTARIAADVIEGSIEENRPPANALWPKLAEDAVIVKGLPVCTAGFVHRAQVSESLVPDLTPGVVVTPEFQDPIGATDVHPVFVVTDCPVLKGQSGGPVFTREGEVIGMQSQLREIGSVERALAVHPRVMRIWRAALITWVMRIGRYER